MEWLNKLDAEKRRWISFALALVALCMMWGNWLTLRGEYREEWKEKIADAGGIGDLAEELMGQFDFDDVGLKLGEAKKMAGAIRDGGLSIAEGKTILGKLSGLMAKVEKSEYADWFLNEDALNIIGKIKTFNVFYQLLFWATVLAGLWAAACRVLLRRDPVGVVSTALFFIWLAAALAVVAQFNERMGGIGAEESFLRITAWSVLAPLCSLAGLLLWGRCAEELKAKKGGGIDLGSLNGSLGTIKEKSGALLNQGKQAINAAAALQKPWSCPACGAQMEAGKKFCSACGAKRPEPGRCAACGAVQEPGVEFCANCGAKFVPQRKCKACGAVLKQNDRFCAKCGAGCAAEEQEPVT